MEIGIEASNKKTFTPTASELSIISAKLPCTHQLLDISVVRCTNYIYIYIFIYIYIYIYIDSEGELCNDCRIVIEINLKY